MTLCQCEIWHKTCCLDIKHLIIVFVFFCCLPFHKQHMVQAGMQTFTPGYPTSTPAVGPDPGLSVAVAAVKNAMNDPLASLKTDTNTSQPNTSSTHVSFLLSFSKEFNVNHPLMMRIFINSQTNPTDFSSIGMQAVTTISTSLPLSVSTSANNSSEQLKVSFW